MVLQIRFAIWLTLQIEVEALHIYKSFHHFASTISAFHARLRSPSPPPRAISLRTSALPAARVRPPYRARPPSSCRACPPSLQVDGAELTRTTTATNDERGLGWAATWPGRRLARTTYVKMARREKKRAGAIGEKKIQRCGLPSPKYKVPWSWTTFRLCKCVWDFANNTKCKIYLQTPLEMLLEHPQPFCK